MENDADIWKQLLGFLYDFETKSVKNPSGEHIEDELGIKLCICARLVQAGCTSEANELWQSILKEENQEIHQFRSLIPKVPCVLFSRILEAGTNQTSKEPLRDPNLHLDHNKSPHQSPSPSPKQALRQQSAQKASAQQDEA